MLRRATPRPSVPSWPRLSAPTRKDIGCGRWRKPPAARLRPSFWGKAGAGGLAMTWGHAFLFALAALSALTLVGVLGLVMRATEEVVEQAINRKDE